MTAQLRLLPHGGLRGAEPPEAGTPYRYRIWRAWRPGAPVALFVGLNPSTASADDDDATLRKCVGYAQRWGFGGVEVVNLFALRSTDPAALATAADPIGPGNDAAIAAAAARATCVVAAWGALGAGPRGDAVARALAAGGDVWCLGLTAAGHPKHPSRAPYGPASIWLPRGGS